ncbi:hypothetical protein FZW96_05650 [Bacillus sp. BGMRC 2118]|nr:hypothetical protein FZW96_05650 [Bacillus sp. BGMRC 2118]
MKNRKLGIDIDGTITNPNTFIPYLNKTFKKNLTMGDIKVYNLATVLGITNEEFYTWMKEHEPLIYKDAPLVNHAISTLSDWEKQHQLIFISARPIDYLDVTNEWFIKNKVPFHHIELIGKHDKLDSVKKHGVEVFFEDKHDNACDISEECNIPVLLFNTPYNQDPVPSKVVRVNDWQEARKWVDYYFS